MKRYSPFCQTFEQLPETVPVFPLTSAVILPGGNLPLNVFEPRYLNMTQDALKSHQLIGMIQPRDESSRPELYSTGCAGRIYRYLETDDGRLEVVLRGVCRFKVLEELQTTRGYRLVMPDWSGFAKDFEEAMEPEKLDRTQFHSALKTYLESKQMQADWKTLDKLGSEELVNNLVSVLPLSVADKQILLEADTLPQRLRAFTAVLEGDSRFSEIRH